MNLAVPRIALAMALALGALACPPRHTPSPVQPLGARPTSCANATSADTTVYDTTQVNERPIARTAPELSYPSEARHRGIRGRVVVTAIVNTDGSIDQPSVTVSQSVHPLLDEEARRFVAGATLWPACRTGQPARVRIAVPVDFVARRPLISPGTAFVSALVIGLLAGLLAHGR
jgi:TonB family protein